MEYKIDKREFMTDIAEENHRAFWKLDQSSSSEHFYSYFRIVAPNFVEFNKDDNDLKQQAREEAERLHQGQPEEVIQRATSRILLRNDIPLCDVVSGVGFEIYGEVCEMEL